MKKTFLFIVMMAFLAISCEQDPLESMELQDSMESMESDKADSSIFSKPQNVSYGYLSFSRAMADNGHTMYVQSDNVGPFFAAFPDGVAGGNTLSVNPKSVQGTGIFIHNDENDIRMASGTWTATELLSYKNYGSAGDDTGFPFADGRAGFANIRVHLVADFGPGAGAEFDAILRIRCLLPGNDSTPPSWVEGIRISVEDGLNFNKTIPIPNEGTLFLAL